MNLKHVYDAKFGITWIVVLGYEHSIVLYGISDAYV